MQCVKVSLAVLLLLTALAGNLARAADVTRIIVPFPPGGSSDTAARVIAKKIGGALGVTTITENQGGANGNIGASFVARSAPDGRTILFATDGYATVNPILFHSSMNYDPAALDPIAIVAFQPALLVVRAGGDIRALQDLLRKGRTTELTYASGGNGSAGHLTMAYLGNLANLKLIHVPFTGGAPAMVALLGGHVDCAFVAIPNALPHVRSGKFLALAVSSAKRLPQLPDVPTVAESGYPEFQTGIASVLAVPSKTPPEVKAKIAAAARAAAETKEFAALMDAGGYVALNLSMRDAAAWIARETQRWREVIKKNGITGSN